MSVKAMSWAWDQAVGRSTKLVLLALADFSDDEGVCWPGLARIGAKCGDDKPMAKSTVSGHLAELQNKGLVRIETRRKDDGSLTSNLYVLAVQGGVRPAEYPPPARRTPSPDNPNTVRTEPSVEPSGEVRTAPPPDDPLGYMGDSEDERLRIKQVVEAYRVVWSKPAYRAPVSALNRVAARLSEEGDAGAVIAVIEKAHRLFLAGDKFYGENCALGTLMGERMFERVREAVDEAGGERHYPEDKRLK